MNEIRERFPNPRSEPCKGCYCVGGAVHLFVEGQTPDAPGLSLGQRYPERGVITSALFELNRKLSWDDAWETAGRIIAANDAGYFETAWAEVEQVLAH